MSRVLKRRRSKETDLEINAGYCKLKNNGDKLANGKYPFPASCRSLDSPTVLGEITEENTIGGQYISTKPALLRYTGQPRNQLIFALKRIVCDIPNDKDLSKRNCKVMPLFMFHAGLSLDSTLLCVAGFQVFSVLRMQRCQS